MVYHSGILVRRHRPSVIKELISNSLTLLDGGYTRSSIIEGVAALELAVGRFARNPDPAKFNRPNSQRIEWERLSQTREHLGFSSFFRYVVPIIFSPERLNDDLLKSASKLIELRQTVVHGGQRSFPDFYILREYIRDVARVCLVLIDSTAEVSTDTAAP